MHDNRIKYFAPADYTEGSDLNKLIKAIIDRTYYNEVLTNIHYKNKKEYEQDEANFTKEQKVKKALLFSLEDSRSFKTTHTVIAEMRRINYWSQFEVNWLIDIAYSNSQVRSIIQDADITRFYNAIIDMADASDKKDIEIKKMLAES